MTMEIRSKGFRVYLRSPELGDAAVIAAQANDPEIANNLANTFPYPYTKADALMFIDFAKRSLADKTGVHLAICDVESGELMGMCGASVDQRNKKIEIGYWLGKKHWGRGYAKEGVKLMLAYVFQNLKFNRATAKTFPGNEKSAHILESLGFKKEGLLRENELRSGKFIDEVFLGLLKKEYKEKAKIEVKEIR